MICKSVVDVFDGEKIFIFDRVNFLVDGENYGFVDWGYMPFDENNLLIFDGENGLFNGENFVNFDKENVDSDTGSYICGNSGEIFFCSGVES
mmetsp:Transcript_37573/g.73579  ORF Transcript_37573/g.73579 Transcript_37573/m.73579 type:complete len:92 (-) Transcript_37573:137-412(-)